MQNPAILGPHVTRFIIMNRGLLWASLGDTTSGS
jgi:hypothetical protein